MGRQTGTSAGRTKRFGVRWLDAAFFADRRSSVASFPLTPVLSLGEREHLARPFDKATASDRSDDQPRGV